MQKISKWAQRLAVGLALAACVGTALADYQTLLNRAKAGDQPAQLELGRAYMYGYEGAPKNSPEAVRWLARAQKAGGDYGRAATVNLGILYGRRSFGQPNGATAVKLLEGVARGSDMSGKMARYNLAALYHVPSSEATIPTNFDKALFWYFAAQASGAPEAPGSGVDAQTARSIRQLMAESSESAVEIRGHAIEWVRKAEGRR